MVDDARRRAHVNGGMRATARAVRKWALRFRWVKYLRQSWRIKRAHGTFKPDRMLLPGAAAVIFLDPHENRARSLLGDLGRKQHSLRELWQRAATALQPDIVIDVGVNYGEFLFTASYPRTARIIGVEANRRLREWNVRSLAAHPNRDQIELVYALASESCSEGQVFYVDPKWSGRSSGIEVRNGLERIEVPSITLDSLFDPATLDDKTLLFKIDVEGFEPKVLQGMQVLLQQCHRAVGMVELNVRSLRPLGLTLDGYLHQLSHRFHVFSLGVPGAVPRLEEVGRRIVAPGQDPERVETNLLLVSDPARLELLGLTALEFAPGAVPSGQRQRF